MDRLLSIAAACLLAAAPAASTADWALARSAHFEVYSDAGTSEARQVLAWFERLRPFFQQETGVNVDPRLPLRIVLFRSMDEYAPFRVNPASDAYFAAIGERDYIVLPAPDSDRLSAHEYWHFVAHTGALRLPRWLNEGLAEFYSTVRFDAHGGRMGIALGNHLGLLRHQPWIRLSGLLSLTSDSPLLREREPSGMFYAESWALVHMLKLSPAYAPRFPQLLERLRSGTPSPQALEQVYARSLQSIADDLSVWLQKDRSIPITRAAPAETVSVEFSAVSQAGVQTLLAQILSGAKPEQAEALYRELAQERPEDGDIAAALALLALARHDLTQARLEWRRALDHGVTDASACFRFAKMAEEAGVTPAEVRPALERAVALDPTFDDALFSLALLENAAGEPEAALRHLRAMHEIAPARRFVYWTATADALNELGSREEATRAAHTAETWATTDEERSQAQSLAYIAETDLAVRFSRDAAGNLRLETTRAPHAAADWNPFIEPGDRVRRVEGHLREIECGTGPTVFILETDATVLALQVPDPHHVAMRNAAHEFTCGLQAETPVVAVYAETGAATGVLRGLEFR
jgi:tetratricopeptide (TPR) repeat protein